MSGIYRATSQRLGSSLIIHNSYFAPLILPLSLFPFSLFTLLMSLSLPAPLFLAARYLKPKRTFLAVITLISVLGVTLGITVLILVMSVMTGFERELQRKVIGFDAHLLTIQVYDRQT